MYSHKHLVPNYKKFSRIPSLGKPSNNSLVFSTVQPIVSPLFQPAYQQSSPLCLHCFSQLINSPAHCVSTVSASLSSDSVPLHAYFLFSQVCPDVNISEHQNNEQLLARTLPFTFIFATFVSRLPPSTRISQYFYPWTLLLWTRSVRLTYHESCKLSGATGLVAVRG